MDLEDRLKNIPERELIHLLEDLTGKIARKERELAWDKLYEFVLDESMDEDILRSKEKYHRLIDDLQDTYLDELNFEDTPLKTRLLIKFRIKIDNTKYSLRKLNIEKDLVRNQYIKIQSNLDDYITQDGDIPNVKMKFPGDDEETDITNAIRLGNRIGLNNMRRSSE
ncbi:MAG: hypothetical protein LBB45_09075 [Methanobrevibacter sp.]|nr:hypothetical protein [Candidatus Methanovirga basalitermitum]